MTTPRTLIAVSLVTLFAATGAVAQEATPDTWSSIGSTQTRAEVRVEAAAALRAGLIESGEASRSAVDFESVKSRAQVRAEAVAAMRLGLTGHGEVSGPSITLAQSDLIRQAGLRAVGVPVAQATR